MKYSFCEGCIHLEGEFRDPCYPQWCLKWNKPRRSVSGVCEYKDHVEGLDKFIAPDLSGNDKRIFIVEF